MAASVLSGDLTKLLDAPRDREVLVRATESARAFSCANTVSESGFAVLADGTFSNGYGAWDLAGRLLEALRLTCKSADDAPSFSRRPSTDSPDAISADESSSSSSSSDDDEEEEEDFGQSQAYVTYFRDAAWQVVDGLLQNKLPMHKVRELRDGLRLSPKEAVLVSTAALESFAHDAQQTVGGAAHALHSLLHKLIVLTQDLAVDSVGVVLRVKPSIARACVAAVHNSLGAFFDLAFDDVDVGSAQRRRLWPSLQSDWESFHQASTLAVRFYGRLIAALEGAQQGLKSVIAPSSSSSDGTGNLKSLLAVCLLDVVSLVTTTHHNDDDGDGDNPEGSREEGGSNVASLLLAKVCSALGRLASSAEVAKVLTVSTPPSHVEPSVVEWERSQCRFLDRRRVRYALVRLTLVSLVPNEAQSAQSALLPRLRLKRHADDVSHLQRKQSDDIIVGGALRGALCPFVWSFLQLCAFCLELLGDLLRGPDAPDLVKVACAQALHFIRACRASSSAVVPAFEKAKKPALAMCEAMHTFPHDHELRQSVYSTLLQTYLRPPDPHVPAEDFFKNLALLRTRALGLLRTCCRDERMFSSVVPADVGQSPDSTFPGVAALLVDAARRLLLLEVTFVEGKQEQCGGNAQVFSPGVLDTIFADLFRFLAQKVDEALPLAVVWLPTVDSVLSLFQFVQLLSAAGRYSFDTQTAPQCFSSAKHFAAKVESAMSVAAAAATATASGDAHASKSASDSHLIEQREMDRNFEEAAWRRIQHKLSTLFADELPRTVHVDSSATKKCDSLAQEGTVAKATSAASLAERWNPLLRFVSESVSNVDVKVQAQVTEAHSRAGTLVEAVTRLSREIMPVMSTSSELTVYLLGAGFKEGQTHQDVKATFRMFLNWLLWQQCRRAVAPSTVPVLQVEFVLVGTEVPYRPDEVSVSSLHEYDGPSDLLPNGGVLAVRTHFLQGLYHELDQATRAALPRPHIVVCFQGGIWGYETWEETFQSILDLPSHDSLLAAATPPRSSSSCRLPVFINTSYNGEEADDDCACIHEMKLERPCPSNGAGDDETSEGRHGAPIQFLWEDQPNPFRSELEQPSQHSGEVLRENHSWMCFN